MSTETFSKDPRVLIVGGGPSGLILALSLVQNGVPVRIIEKNTEPRLGQRGAGIMPRSLELFTSLRLIEPVLKKAILTPQVRMYRLPGGVEVLHEFEMCPYKPPTPTHPFLNPIMLGQDSLEKIFHSALAEYGCTVELGTELVSFTQDDSSVSVTLAHRGSNPKESEVSTIERVSYDWVIGCDGARGVVRKQLGLSFLGETRNVQNFIVGDVVVEGLEQNFWHIWGDSSDIMISLRGTETPNLFNFFIGGKNVKHSKLAGSYDSLKACFIQHTGRRKDLKFREIPWMSNYTPNIRMVEQFGRGRVMIVGDAGHVHSPTGGQGMNTGIQDSFNLGWKLALVANGLAKPSLLDTYTEERIPVIAEMISQTTELLNRTLENDNTAWTTDSSLYQLGVNYRWSSIVLDERKALEKEEKEDSRSQSTHGDHSESDEGSEGHMDSYGLAVDGRLRAGDRAPDASSLVIQHPSHLSPHRCQLFQIFDAKRHTVVIFSQLVDPHSILEMLGRYPSNLWRAVVIVCSGKSFISDATGVAFALEDTCEHAYNAYCQTGNCGICVIRPDGILGAIVNGSMGVGQYFSRVFSALPVQVI